MGTNCAPLFADLFIYSYENEFLDNTIKVADDLTTAFNSKKFSDYLIEIYQSQLAAEKVDKSDHLASYLDLRFMTDIGGKFSTRLYDKHDDFDFHIVNFPFLSSNHLALIIANIFGSSLDLHDAVFFCFDNIYFSTFFTGIISYIIFYFLYEQLVSL